MSINLTKVMEATTVESDIQNIIIEEESVLKRLNVAKLMQPAQNQIDSLNENLNAQVANLNDQIGNIYKVKQPTVSDEGKILQVVNGTAIWTSFLSAEEEEF